MFRFSSCAARLLLITLLPLLVSPLWLPRLRAGGSAERHSATVLVGIDVLEERRFEGLNGKRVGLITNQTGVDSRGRRTIDVLANAPGVKLLALFSPEHGIAGNSHDAIIADSTDKTTGLRIYSLYGKTQRPTDRMLKGLDVLVFDIQDAGVRFYTYLTTMAYCMEEAAKHRIQFVVLDRPNPLSGEVIEGPVLDAGRLSFTGYFPMPARYGMTIGELARMFNVENRIAADLEIFPLRNWNRAEGYDQTGLAWIAPSPNLRTTNEAVLYPGIEILQAGGVSVGRGTDTPFEILGAPWIRSDEFAAELNQRKIPGVGFEPLQFTPKEDLYQGKACGGVKMGVSDGHSFRSTRLALEIADALHRMYEQFQLEKIAALLGSPSTIDRLQRGDAPVDIIAGWSVELDKFRRMREKYLLYR